MTVPTNIPETPMAHTNHESLHESKEDSTTSKSMEAYQLVLKTVVDIQNEDEIQSFSKWMNYRGYDNFTDLCADFYHILDHIHDCSDYRVDGQECALKFGTINKIRMLISWMTTKMTEYTFELYAEHLLALTRHQFIKFRQADMIRMNDMSKSTPPEPTMPMTIFTSHTKGSIASESQVALNNFKKGTKRDASAYPMTEFQPKRALSNSNPNG